MEIHDFLDKALQEPIVLYEAKSVFYLRGAEEAPLFYTAFAQHISNQLALNPINIDLRSFDEEAQVDALLDISFLGHASLYVLRNAASLSNITQKYLFSRLSTYNGPHSVIISVDEDCPLSSSKCPAVFGLTINKQVTINYALYFLLMHFLTGKPSADKEFVAKIFEQHKHISLENACVLIRYHSLLGRYTEEFGVSWLTRLIATEYSLFLLSQHFFAKNSNAFIAMWEQVRALYPDEFWLAFWSEQLWQGSFFIKEAQASSPMLARKQVNRLPFSFTNKDWQKYSFTELMRAHDFLYILDYHLKNGAGSFGLDLFFAKFLNNLFR